MAVSAPPSSQPQRSATKPDPGDLRKTVEVDYGRIAAEFGDRRGMRALLLTGALGGFLGALAGALLAALILRS